MKPIQTILIPTLSADVRRDTRQTPTTQKPGRKTDESFDRILRDCLKK